MRDEGGSGSGRRPLPRVSPVRKVMLVASLLVAALGLGMWAYAAATQPAPSGAAAGAPGEHREEPPPLAIAPQGLAPMGPRGEEPAAPATPGEPSVEGLAAWSPAVFRLGFGFFAGFCMAYALRAFMKVTLTVIGVGLLGLFGLQYAGLIDVNWGAMEGVYNAATAWLSEQTESFTRFVSGYLPTAASGAAGFLAGFTTRR